MGADIPHMRLHLQKSLSACRVACFFRHQYLHITRIFFFNPGHIITLIINEKYQPIATDLIHIQLKTSLDVASRNKF